MKLPGALLLAAGAVSLGIGLSALPLAGAGESGGGQAKGAADKLGAAPTTVRRLKEQIDAEVQKLVHQLGVRSFKARRAAMKQLTQIGRPALPALRKALKETDLEVRQRARQVIHAIRTSLPYLLENLDHEDAQVRKGAVETLEGLGSRAKTAIPALARALKDDDEGVRDAALSALMSIDPRNKVLAGKILARARVDGKYSKLLKRIKVPADKATYTEFSDFGFYEGTDWAGYTNLPAGYWVYVYPYWYIWGEAKNG
jgi:hypothetical protein